MATLQTDDGIKLYYEETGTGLPIVFVHEFAGDYRSWEPQVRQRWTPAAGLCDPCAISQGITGMK